MSWSQLSPSLSSVPLWFSFTKNHLKPACLIPHEFPLSPATCHMSRSIWADRNIRHRNNKMITAERTAAQSWYAETHRSEINRLDQCNKTPLTACEGWVSAEPPLPSVFITHFPSERPTTGSLRVGSLCDEQTWALVRQQKIMDSVFRSFL